MTLANGAAKIQAPRSDCESDNDKVIDDDHSMEISVKQQAIFPCLIPWGWPLCHTADHLYREEN